MASYNSLATRTDRLGAVDEYHHSLVFDDKPASVPTPGYFGKVRRGEVLPVGNWEREFVTAGHSGARTLNSYLLAKSTGTLQGNLYEGDIFWPAVRHLLDRTHLISQWAETEPVEDQLAIKAINGAKNAAWDVTTFGAELDKSIRLIKKAEDRTFKRAEDILFRRGPGKAIKTVYEFASAWLEYRYGWRLFMYDAMEAIESLERLRDFSRHSLQRFTAHEQSSFSRVTEESIMRVGGTSASTYTDNHTDITSTLVVDERVGAGVLSTFAHLATINPLLTVWEIIPYSFVVDMFVNVGDVIGANTPTVGRSLQYVWHTRKMVLSTRSQSSWTPANPSPSVYEHLGEPGSCGAEITWTKYTRNKIVHPGWELNRDLNLDWSKVADLASLALMRDKELMSGLKI